MEMLSKNRWLYIILTIMAIPTIGFFGILYVSIKYIPVNKENYLLEKYANVDDNFNKIIANSIEFKKNFNFSFNVEKKGEDFLTFRSNGDKVYFPHVFTIGENSFSFNLKTKDNIPVDNATAEILLTRFETNDFDKKLTISTVKNGTYTVKPFQIEKTGRWKAIIKITVDKYQDIYEYRVFAK